MENTKTFLFYPILFLVVLLGIDKIFTLPFFADQFTQNGNIVYYRHRPFLFERLKKEPTDKKKLIVAFGDSRAYAYSELAFEGARKESFQVYNFSGPQTVAAYPVFWLEKMVEQKIDAKLLLLVLSPEGFDDSKGMYNSPLLRMGVDSAFIQKYLDYIPEKDKEEYYFDRIVSFRKLEFDYKLFIERIKTRSFSEYLIRNNKHFPILNISKGAQLAYMSFQNNVKELEKDTLRIKNIYLGKDFKIGNSSFYFVKRFLEIAKENRIQVFVVWPRVYPKYKLEYDKLNLDQAYGERLKQVTIESGGKYFDLNKDLICDEYYDASHQSVSCFGKNMNFFVDEYEKLNK